MASSSKQELATTETEAYPVLLEHSGEFADVIRENFGDEGVQPSDLDRITIPAGGALSWAVPTIDGEDAVKEIEGIIVAWQSPRAYWESRLEDSGGGQPPDCASDDSKFGNGAYGPGSESNPSGECAVCPMNAWASADDGKGKACKEMRLLFILQPQGVLPVTVALPPTSIQPLRKYFLRLASAGVPYYGVTTKLGLKRVTGQYTYSVVEPRMGSRLDVSHQDAAKVYGESIKKSMGTRVARDASQAVLSDDDSR